MSNSDFPDFDQAYKTILIKDPDDRFEQLAAQANFNVYHSDIWRGTGRKFAELIVAECLDIVEDEDDGSADTKAIRWAMIRIKKHFGVE